MRQIPPRLREFQTFSGFGRGCADITSKFAQNSLWLTILPIGGVEVHQHWPRLRDFSTLGNISEEVALTLHQHLFKITLDSQFWQKLS